MIKTDVLIVGGSAAGIVAAVTAKSNYPDAEVTVIRKEKEVLVPCGIPYIFGSLESSQQNIIPDANLDNAGVKILVDEVISVDYENRTCKPAAGEVISFDKLVFATGSTPKVPEWLKGANLENVFTVPKNKIIIDELSRKLINSNKIVVVGGGFIGVEISDELNKAHKDVTIVEMLPHVLAAVFDDEAAKKAEEILKSRGVKVKTGSGIKEIAGQGKASAVILQNGEEIEADVVILSMGYVPNTDLAKSSGVSINEFGQIKVDEFMRTDKPNVFAIGDCAGKRDFITRRKSCTMLASTACTEARIVGMNLFKLSTLKTFKGTIALFSTVIGESVFGVAGITFREASKQNIDAFSARFEGPDKHPGKLPGMQMQSVELVIAKNSGLLLGGTVIGGISAGELVNAIGLAIQNAMTVYDLLTAQIGTHPLLTASPIAYPLIKAAEVAVKKIREL